MESCLNKVDKIEKRLDSISQDVDGLKNTKVRPTYIPVLYCICIL